MGTVAFTILICAVWAIVMLLCLPRLGDDIQPKKRYQGQHTNSRTVEQDMFEIFIDAWLKGEEHWLKYAWIEPWSDTVSWG